MPLLTSVALILSRTVTVSESVISEGEKPSSAIFATSSADIDVAITAKALFSSETFFIEAFALISSNDLSPSTEYVEGSLFVTKNAFWSIRDAWMFK